MKKIITVTMIGFLAVLLFLSLKYESRETFLQLELVTLKQYESLIENKEKVDIENELLFGGIPAPYDSINDQWIFYGEEPKYGIDINGDYGLAWLKNDVFTDTEESIENNEIFSLIVYNREEYCVKNIKITTLPIISIDVPEIPTQKQIVIDDNSQKWIESGKINYYGRSFETEEIKGQSYHVNMNVRGVSTVAFDKQSYKINIRDEKNQPKNVALSSTRNDNDWILNAIHSDRSKIREKYISDLWRNMLSTQKNSQITGFGMEYVEVLVNEEYLGVYTLTEPIDAKQLKINKENEFIFKCNSWFSDGTSVINELLITDAKAEIGPHIEIEHVPNDFEENPWLILGNYFLEFTKENVTLEMATKVTDIENLIDFFIIKMYGGLVDCDPKNMFFVGIENETNHVIHKELWDLNYSLGDTYVNNLDELYTTSFEPEEFLNITEEVGKLLKGEDSELVKEMIQQRWTFLRENKLSSTQINQDIDNLFEELNHSGVLEREQTKWQQDIDSNFEINRIKDFTMERIKLMDEIIWNL